MKIRGKKSLAWLLCGAAAFSLSACSFHDINRDPVPSVKAIETFSMEDQAGALQLDGKPWWGAFNRPVLNALIAHALVNNQDVAQSIATYKQARAISNMTGSDRLPQLDLESNASKDWEGSDAQRGASDIGGALSWEIDVFDRIGSARRADIYEAQARMYDVDATRLTLSAEVANAYFGAVSAQERIKLLRSQLKLDRELQGLLELRLNNGVGTNVDVLQQKSRVADSEALIPVAQSEAAVFENRLDVLLGFVPDGQSRVQDDESLDFISTMPAIGVPAVLLLNRPDLKSAQASLIAADADIASAIADRLPRITLTGSYAFSDTASYTGPVGLIMGGFIQPLLDWGKRKSEVERNEALYEERLARFTQTFLEAVEDVENALIQERKQREYIYRLQQREAILKETVSATEDRYTEGVDDYLPVINALQELREVERNLITQRLELINIRISLFRAIGGPIKETPTDYKKEETQIKQGS